MYCMSGIKERLFMSGRAGQNTNWYPFGDICTYIVIGQSACLGSSATTYGDE